MRQHSRTPRRTSPRLVGILATALLLGGSFVNAAPLAAAAPPEFGSVPAVKFRLPFSGGQMWTLSRSWHFSDWRNYYAIDFVPPNAGGTPRLPVVAAAAGKVIDVDRGNGECMTGSTNDNSSVIIDHEDGTFSEYVHVDQILVVEGERVEQGELIARVGCIGHTCCVDGTHLHFARLFDNDPRAGYVSYVSMKTAFVDERDSGTHASPASLSANHWYLSYNGTHGPDDNVQCSQNTAAPSTDTRYAIPSGAFCARYYRTKTPGVVETVADKPPSGNPGAVWTTTQKSHVGMSRIEPHLDHTWGSSSFLEAQYLDLVDYRDYAVYFSGLPNFSARWVGRWGFSVGVYEFRMRVSDGVRLYIDGQLEFDSWTTRGSTADLELEHRFTTSGSHIIRFDYFNDGPNPVADIDWTSCAHGGCD